MQEVIQSQRPSQRRQGGTPEPSSSTASTSQKSSMDQSAQPGQQPRNVSGSARGHGSRSSNPDKQISQIEKSVTHLLVATKQLLETLTQWSRGNAQEEEVSDVYVRLGYEFNLACRAFNSIGVETSDLGPVPDLLRTILEDTLSQPASPQALDNYLPRIRDIIINLLQGLKRKQSKLRSKSAKDLTTSNVSASSKSVPTPPRQSSLGGSNGTEDAASGLGGATLTDNGPAQVTIGRAENRSDSPAGSMSKEKDWVPANSSVERGSLRRSIRRDNHIPSTDSTSTMSSGTAQSLPVLPPTDIAAANANAAAMFPHPPPPPPKQDALAALSRGGDLERRASRRFSAYQIQKHLGTTPNNVPVIPPAQNSPVPNRGREVRESMRAVTSRTSHQPTRTKSTRLHELSPSRSGSVKAPAPIPEEQEKLPRLDTENVPTIPAPVAMSSGDSPTTKTPDEFRAKVDQSPGPNLAATVNGPFSPLKEELTFTSPSLPAVHEKGESEDRASSLDGAAKSTQSDMTLEDRATTATPPPTNAVDMDSSPPQTKELTLFLQYKSRIKKFILPDGYEDLTIPRLQLAFIEKFAWNTHNNGVDLPDIYIQDPVSGVRHELEDLNDVKDRSVLVLNVEVLDEVKKHFDDGIGGLKTTLESVRSLLDGQGNMMQRFSDRQLEASKEMARISAAPAPRITRAPTTNGDIANLAPVSEATVTEVQNLRRDIAVLRQSYSTMSSDFAAAMNNIKAKAAKVKEAAANAAAPSYEGSAGRMHVNEGKKNLGNDSEKLVNRVDDLSDRVEDLRKDVVTRGVRPRPRDLEMLSLEISTTAKELSKVKDWMKREKPVWTKIWEQELNQVCTERDELTQQEELMADLHGDLEDVQNVFNLVEEAMKQQNISGGPIRSTSKNIDIDPTVDPKDAKEGVLDEVRALRPNHEDRLEAIERAEKQRQKDLANRKTNEFQREVENFVEEGKLKKTGGVDEVERVRKLKDERAAKENWERAAAREAERERKRAEKLAEKAAAIAAAAQPTPQVDGSAAPASEPQENVPSLEEIMGGAPPANDDASQEPKTPYEDAPTGTTPAVEATDPMNISSSPPPPPLPAKDDEQLPIIKQEPDAEIEQRTASPTNEPINTSANTNGLHESTAAIKQDTKHSTAENDKRGSWWKPAVF